MAKQSTLLSVAVRSVVALALLAAATLADKGDIEYGWAAVLAATSTELYLKPDRHERGLPAQIYHDGPVPGRDPTRIASIGTRIAPQCTYVHVAAVMAPFLVRRLSWRDLLRGCTATVVIVFFVNYVRLRIFFAGLHDYSQFWHHDLPHYICVTGCIAGAIWWWHRTLLKEHSSAPGPESAAVQIGQAAGSG